MTKIKTAALTVTLLLIVIIPLFRVMDKNSNSGPRLSVDELPTIERSPKLGAEELALSSEEQQKIILEFKSTLGNRTDLARKIIPLIKMGMTKDEVSALLGAPSSRHSNEQSWFYGVFYSTAIIVKFNSHGEVIAVVPLGID